MRGKGPRVHGSGPIVTTTPDLLGHQGGSRSWERQQPGEHDECENTGMSVYRASSRPYHGLEELEYPLHDWSAIVTHCGRICFESRKINLSHVFAGQKVGIKQVEERIWLVSFMHYDLGYFDDETCRLEPIENPFGPTVLPISSAPSVRIVVARLACDQRGEKATTQ